MRPAPLILIIGGFAGLGLLDIAHGHYTTGAAALLLAIVNALLLVAAA